MLKSIIVVCILVFLIGCDTSELKVVSVSPVDSIGNKGPKGSDFSIPIEFRGMDNKFYIVDPVKPKILVYSIIDGNFLYSIGTKGDSLGMLRMPQGIAPGFKQNFYVTDVNSGRINYYNNDGVFLRAKKLDKVYKIKSDPYNRRMIVGTHPRWGNTKLYSFKDDSLRAFFNLDNWFRKNGTNIKKRIYNFCPVKDRIILASTIDPKIVAINHDGKELATKYTIPRLKYANKMIGNIVPYGNGFLVAVGAHNGKKGRNLKSQMVIINYDLNGNIRIIYKLSEKFTYYPPAFTIYGRNFYVYDNGNSLIYKFKLL